jgi:hypothetical protein
VPPETSITCTFEAPADLVAGSQQLHVAAVGPDGQQLSELVLEVEDTWDVSSSARRSLLGKGTECHHHAGAPPPPPPRPRLH